MIKEQLKEAKKACRFMQNVKPEVKNKALKNISEALIQKSELIIQENQKDTCKPNNIWNIFTLQFFEYPYIMKGNIIL